MFKYLPHLIRKEFMLEWKQRYALSGLLLYVVTTIFVCYLCFKKVVDVPSWNALFWIILLFASVNAVAKSFMQESRHRNLYYYTLAAPQVVIGAKLVYNTLLLFTLALIHLLVYGLLIGNPVQDLPLFMVALMLGVFGLASVMTLISAIASKAGANSTLMAILGFPVLMPLLLTSIRLSKNAVDGLTVASNQQFIIVLIALNIAISALAIILFPYLWRE